jgi:hypothetical protein
MPGADLRSLRHQDAIKVVLAYPNFGKAFREGLDKVKSRRAGGRKITDICIVRPLPERDIVHEFRDDPVEVHIALAVGVGGEIDGYAIHKTGEIRAMVQI